MAKAQELNFKPYVGHFFQFVDRIRKNPKSAIVGQDLYGNQIRFGTRKKFHNIESLPQSVLVVDEKRNHVRFLSSDNQYYWTTKAQLEPIDLPTYDGNPGPMLQEYRDFLVYCTNTRIADFSIEVMTKKAIDLLPKIDSAIENFKIKIIPSGK